MTDKPRLDPEDINAISWAVRSGMLQVSQELSDFFVNPVNVQYEAPREGQEVSIAFPAQRAQTDNLHLRIQVTPTSIILEWWAWGYVILDRFIFARPIHHREE